MSAAERAPPVDVIGDDGRPRRLEDIEIAIIRGAVEACNGNISEAARALGIGRTTIHRKLRAVDAQKPAEPAP